MTSLVRQWLNHNRNITIHRMYLKESVDIHCMPEYLVSLNILLLQKSTVGDVTMTCKMLRYWCYAKCNAIKTTITDWMTIGIWYIRLNMNILVVWRIVYSLCLRFKNCFVKQKLFLTICFIFEYTCACHIHLNLKKIFFLSYTYKLQLSDWHCRYYSNVLFDKLQTR